MIKTTTTTKKEHCDLSNPVLFENLGDGKEVQYSEVDCIATSTTKEKFTTSTTTGINNGFTYGEIVSSTWLFLIFLILIFSVAWFGFIKPNAVRNKQNSEI